MVMRIKLFKSVCFRNCQNNDRIKDFSLVLSFSIENGPKACNLEVNLIEIGSNEFA